MCAAEPGPSDARVKSVCPERGNVLKDASAEVIRLVCTCVVGGLTLSERLHMQAVTEAAVITAAEVPPSTETRARLAFCLLRVMLLHVCHVLRNS